jgi:multiple sugar transport system substrate-binding protein
MARLHGITWDHPRGYQGLFAATAAYREAHPEVEIRWDRQPLRGFEAHPIADLAARYDLVVLDHPFMGDVAAEGCLIGLSPYWAELDADDLASDVVGASFESYRYAGEVWALPLDTACQVAAYRRDLLARLDMELPMSSDAVRALARRGPIAIALHGVHGFLVFLALCANLGSPPSESGEPFIAAETGLHALDILREMASWAPPEALHWNAIAALDAMRERDDLAYCPCIFGYSAYSNPAPGAPRISFAPIPGVRGRDGCGAVLGGTGLGISRRCADIPAAIAFARYLTSASVQRAMGMENGQPARRSAWRDPTLNAVFDDFFRATIGSMECAYMRPRFPGYIALQNAGGESVHRFLTGTLSPRETIACINQEHAAIRARPL